MGYVYKITNTVNNKSYIGATIHEPEKGRIKDHLSGSKKGNRLIANAVKEYGKDAFTYEILEADVFDEFLPNLEVAYIAHYNTIAPHGYNLDSGGGGAGLPCAESRRKMSESAKGKIIPANTRRKMSEANSGEKNGFFGKTHSAETCRKISEIKKNDPRAIEHCRSLSEANKGKKLSEEHCRKIGEALTGRTRSAKHCHKLSKALTGRTFSEEHCRNISEAKRHPDYMHGYEYFLSIPPSMSLQEKRKLLYTTFPHINKRTIRGWIEKWDTQATNN